MRQGMESMKHSRNRPTKMLDATDNSRRRKHQRDLWKSRRREQKRQTLEW